MIIEINSIAAMQVLLQKGANLNSQDHYGMTPLHHAVQRKNIEGAMFLLSDEMIGKGININILVILLLLCCYWTVYLHVWLIMFT